MSRAFVTLSVLACAVAVAAVEAGHGGKREFLLAFLEATGAFGQTKLARPN